MVLFFYLFVSLALLSSIGVITAKNPVNAVLYLIFVFCNTSGILILSGVEFLAFLIAISYAGAVAMLFLFIVMMLDIKKTTSSLWGRGSTNTYIALIVVCTFITNLIIVIYAGFKNHLFPRSYSVHTINNIKSIGSVLYTEYILPFQLSGVILLISMIGCIALTIRKKSGTKKQNAFIQLTRTREDSVEVVKVEIGKGVQDNDFN